MPQPGQLKQLWYRWKSLDLPWRKQWLRGIDLAGNTFWEFKDHMNANRLRRIVKYNPRAHYADVKLTPPWVQWLRHARVEPPSINEQQLDEIRQARMKQLAVAADARWASKPSALDPPSFAQPAAALSPRDPAGYTEQTEPDAREGVRNAAATPDEVDAVAEGAQSPDKGRFRGETAEKHKEKKDAAPWEKHAPQQQEWQPDSWSPKPARRR